MSNLPLALLAEDDMEFAEWVSNAISDQWEVLHVTSVDALERSLSEHEPEIILLDLELEGGWSTELIPDIRREVPETPILVVSLHDDSEQMAAVVRLGATGFLTKRAPHQLLRRTLQAWATGLRVHRRLTYHEQSREHEAGRPANLAQPLGSSPAMVEVREQIRRFARHDVDVLIFGESGTGKELVARAIHRASSRRAQPLETFDLAAIPTDLIQSHLFGAERGAYTGATGQMVGALEAAAGGTIFLDEIGTLDLSAQRVLLGVLQNREFKRLGGRRRLRATCRFLVATNEDLVAAVGEKRFREDLFYRVHKHVLRIPALRERPDDIHELSTHFLARHALRFGVTCPRLSEEAITRLRSHRWPGNVRELENALEAALIQADGEELSAAHIERVLAGTMSWAGVDMPAATAGHEPSELLPRRILDSSYHQAREEILARFKRYYVLGQIERSGDVVNEAARKSALSESSFRRMLKEVRA